MLLNLGYVGHAPAAIERCTQPECRLAPNSPSSSALSLPSLSCLGNFYNQINRRATPAGTVAAVALSPVAQTPTEIKSSQAASHALSRSRIFLSNPKETSRPGISYQFAYPVVRTWHKRLTFRPKLLLQMQQVSQTQRPLPILDVQQSTLYLPRFVRKFSAMFHQKNGLGTYGLSVIRSELYTGEVGSIPEKRIGCEGEDHDHQRRLVATIFRMAEADGGLKGKAEIHLNFGPVWEATPLPSGSYEFVTRTEYGVQVMRWALRGEKNRYPSAAPGTQLRHKAKRFTFSIIDPNTRRHPVLASMTKSQLKVYTGYSAVATPSPGPITPSLSISVISGQSDNEEMVDTKHAVALDDGLPLPTFMDRSDGQPSSGFSKPLNHTACPLVHMGKAATSSSPVYPFCGKVYQNLKAVPNDLNQADQRNLEPEAQPAAENHQSIFQPNGDINFSRDGLPKMPTKDFDS